MRLSPTLQAISGAGYPGLPSYDILDNAIPYISGEEEKVERETRKMLGSWEPGHGFTDAPITVSAQCNRVATREGHLECVSVELGSQVPLEELIAAWETYQKPPLSAPGFSHRGEKGVPSLGPGLGVPLPLDFANASH